MGEYRQVGAQDQCPCGSGKKYIDCCLDGNTRWLVGESGETIRMQTFSKDAPQEGEVEDIPLLRLDVQGGKLAYAKNSHISRLAGFPPESLKMCLSVLEVEKTKALLDCFGMYLERNQGILPGEGDREPACLADGSYVLVMVRVDCASGHPIGMGGRSVSESLDEQQVMSLIGAYEEIKTDISLCLMVNSMMNGIIGSVDYGGEE